MGLLHILLGVLFRAAVPQRGQDLTGKVLFWGFLLFIGWLAVLAVIGPAAGY